MPQSPPEEEDDDSLLADFLSDVSREEIRILTGQIGGDETQEKTATDKERETEAYYKSLAAASFVSNYELVVKMLL